MNGLIFDNIRAISSLQKDHYLWADKQTGTIKTFKPSLFSWGVPPLPVGIRGQFTDASKTLKEQIEKGEFEGVETQLKTLEASLPKLKMLSQLYASNKKLAEAELLDAVRKMAKSALKDLINSWSQFHTVVIQDLSHLQIHDEDEIGTHAPVSEEEVNSPKPVSHLSQIAAGQTQLKPASRRNDLAAAPASQNPHLAALKQKIAARKTEPIPTREFSQEELASAVNSKTPPKPKPFAKERGNLMLQLNLEVQHVCLKILSKKNLRVAICDQPD